MPTVDGRRYADEPEPQWYGDRDWRTPAADAPEDDPRAVTRPRRAPDPLTDPTGYSDHWNVPRIRTPEPAETPAVPELPAQPEARSRRGYEYDAVTGRAVEALPVVTPPSALPVEPAPATDPDAGRTATYPLTGDVPRFRTEALDRAALRRPPADPSAAVQPPVAARPEAPADPTVHPPAAPAFLAPAGEPPYTPPTGDFPYGRPVTDPGYPAADPAYPGAGTDPAFPAADPAYPGTEPSFTPGGERVYTTRRPILAVPIGLVVVLLEVPGLRLLLNGFTGGTAAAGNLVSGLALVLSLPLIGVGLYALLTTGRAADHRTWWRPPLAYLPLGLILLLAAAVAVR